MSGSGLVLRLGWTLVHFLWQGALVALLLAAALAWTRGAPLASARDWRFWPCWPWFWRRG